MKKFLTWKLARDLSLYAGPSGLATLAAIVMFGTRGLLGALAGFVLGMAAVGVVALVELGLASRKE